MSSITHTGSGKKADCDVTEKLKREVAAMRVEYKCRAFPVSRTQERRSEGGITSKLVAAACP